MENDRRAASAGNDGKGSNAVATPPAPGGSATATAPAPPPEQVTLDLSTLTEMSMITKKIPVSSSRLTSRKGSTTEILSALAPAHK